MKNTFARNARLWMFSFVAAFYTTWIFQQLWNWFIVSALNAHEITYWQMYGVNLLVDLFILRDTFLEEERFNRVMFMAYASIPPDKRKEVGEALEADNEQIWFRAGYHVSEKLLGATFCFGIGWAVHTFLM